MQIIESSRYLVQYIKSVEDLEFTFKKRNSAYTHIGALFTDIILQAGLNYSTVVKPRVNRVLYDFPQANNLRNLQSVIEQHGLEKIIRWSHPVKIERFLCLLDFCAKREINSCNDLKTFLSKSDNRTLFLSLKGIGPKTLDYTMKLLDFDTIAVDRHIIGFIELAGLKHKDYDFTKRTVEFAADLLEVSRASLDETIWSYMSTKSVIDSETPQLKFTF